MAIDSRPPISTLVLIDDNPMDQMLYKRVIDRSGLVANTISFLAADEALTFMQSDACPDIDAIILDVNMPRMDGFEFLEELAKMGAAITVKMVIVMLTTSLDPRDQVRAEASPLVREFLYKPLNEEHLRMIASEVRMARG